MENKSTNQQQQLNFNMGCMYMWPATPNEFGQYLIVAVTSLTILIAAPGNILTAIVVMRNISLRNEPAYILICSVCCADAIVAIVTQPLFVTTILLGSRFSCTIDHVFFAFAWLSSVSSTLGIVTITFDRYAYIVHPLHYQSIMTKQRAKYMIIVVWTTAVLFSVLPLLYHNRLILQTSVLGITSLIAVFMIVTYSKVYRQVVNSVDHPPVLAAAHHQKVNLQKMKNALKQKSQNQATKTVLFVVLAFFGCWSPWVIISFLMALGEFVPRLKAMNLVVMHWVFLGLGYSNSALNIFIYSRKNTVLQKAVSRFLVKKNLPLLSCILVGKQIEEKAPSIAYVEERRLRAATILNKSANDDNNNNNNSCPYECSSDKRRSKTFISGLSF